MPTYIFKCDNEEGGCGHTWETEALMCEIERLHPVCPECKQVEAVGRDWLAENVGMQMVCTTLGAFTERKTDRMSEDEKIHLHKTQNAYKDKKFHGKLPEGAKIYERDSSGERKISRKQRRKPKKRKGAT
jgi:hypothetical protein